MSALPYLLALPLLAANVLASWPDFRGPESDGRASAPGNTKLPGLPLHWSETSNVVWKTAIPHKGWSTPVILNRQIWLTTATADGKEFFALCVDADSGKILFNERLFHCATPEPLGNNLNGYASPSPVIEAGRVYVHFGSYGTACLDTVSFKVIWKRDDLPCRHFRGPGSSPVLFNDLLILTMDGIDLQYVVALDNETGKTVWKTDRTANWDDLEADGRPRGDGDFRKAYSTPLIVSANGKTQMLSIGSKAAYSYDPHTGREIWKINHSGFSGATRPLYDRGVAYFSTGHGKGEMLAVKTDGQGDVTRTHILWRHNRGFPRMPSPVLVDGLIFMVNDNGIASCLEAATGKELWQERLGGDYAASVLYADGRVYCFSQQGKTTVLKAARAFEVLATNELPDGLMASPAVDGKALILRTKSHLYRVQSASGK
ncbi:MAG TPA: PQQ-binding-like beta-propeller repeat protein [Verrucomicrobiae bacterium]|nr:PQQ-binding-like beta-propeller repeat protein [Verrucomicrobiae bacterium]